MWDSVHSCLIVHSWDVFMDWQSRNRTQEDMCSRHIVVCGKDTDNFRKCSSPQLHGPQFSMKTLCLKRKRDRSKLIICIYCIYMYIYINDLIMNSLIWQFSSSDMWMNGALYATTVKWHVFRSYNFWTSFVSLKVIPQFFYDVEPRVRPPSKKANLHDAYIFIWD